MRPERTEVSDLLLVLMSLFTGLLLFVFPGGLFLYLLPAWFGLPLAVGCGVVGPWLMWRVDIELYGPPAMIPAILICTVAYVTDADTFRCQTGERVRLAGVSALEQDGSCNSRPYCARVPHRLAKPIAERIALGRTYQFTIYGTSGKRLVGDNPGLRCALIRSGAAVEWPTYSRRYGLEACR